MKLLSFCWHPTKAIKSHLSFPYPSFTAINHEHGSLGFPPVILGKKTQTFGQSMVGEIEFIDLHRDPYTNKCKVGPKPRFWKRRSFLGWAKNGVGGNCRRFFWSVGAIFYNRIGEVSLWICHVFFVVFVCIFRRLILPEFAPSFCLLTPCLFCYCPWN